MNETILPPLPTGEDQEEKQRQQRYDEVRQYLLDARQNYPEPYYMLEYNGVPFSAIGGIQAISGQKKNGKTFVLAQLMAAILGVNSERAKTYLPGLKVPERTLEHLGHDPKVLYVDTEMEQLNSAKVLRRVHWLCDWSMDVPNERFHVLWLRGITDTKDDEGKIKERAYKRRYRLIRTAIEMFQPDAVFIDGLRDIMADFNNLEESASIIGELMALAEQNHICIWNALHMNPRPGNDDESKMRGHAGTELGNKATDTIVSYKKKESNGRVTFTVKQLDARGKDMEDWKFEVTEAAGALGIPRICGTTEVLDMAEQQRQNIDAIFREYSWNQKGVTYTALENYLRSKGITSNRKLNETFNIAKEHNIIYKNGNGRYMYNGLQKDIPNDIQENLPFPKPDNEDEPF